MLRRTGSDDADTDRQMMYEMALRFVKRAANAATDESRRQLVRS
jgi:hypothetical protein